MESFETFAELLNRHLRQGTRPDVPRGQGSAWTRDSFLTAMKAVDKTGVSVTTYRNWIVNGTAPRASHIETMAVVLFGSDPALADKRTAFESFAKQSREPAAAPISRLETVSGPAPASRIMHNARLLDFTVELPTQGAASGAISVVIDAQHGAERVDGVAVHAVVGLKEVLVEYDAKGCQPETNAPRFGDSRRTPYDPANSFPFRPGKETAMLTGRTTEVLTSFVPQPGHASCSVTLKAETHSDHLHVHFRDDPDPLPGKLKGVLGQYIKNKGYPKNGAIPLGEATIEWEDEG